MKKIAVIVLIMTLALTLCVSAATVDGTEIETIIKSGVTLAPVSELASLLGLDFKTENGGFMTIDSNLDSIEFRPSSCVATLRSYVINDNGVKTVKKEWEEELPSAAEPINGKLYVPFRYLCESAGARVYWSAEEGASAERTKYGKMTLIRAKAGTREIIAMPDGFENALIRENIMLFIKDNSLYKMDMETEETKRLCTAGKIHVSGDDVFIMASGEVNKVSISTGEVTHIADNVKMVGYTISELAWCETAEGPRIYDKEGKLVCEVTGQFANAFEYLDGYVYYTTATYELRRAYPDGTADEFLAKSAYYPEIIDGFVYYTDMAGNFRSVDIETKKDIMVYGLNLEICGKFGDKYLYNFFSDAPEKHRMFYGNGDGTEFLEFGGTGVIAERKPIEYGNGIYFRNTIDSGIYFATSEKTEKLTDDILQSFCGVYDGYAYYTVK